MFHLKADLVTDIDKRKHYSLSKRPFIMVLRPNKALII